MNKDIIRIHKFSKKFMYISLKRSNVAIEFHFMNGQLWTEKYRTPNNIMLNNLNGAALLEYTNRIVTYKHYSIQNNYLNINNDLEFDRYVKGLILK
jgi:hypothetical protein